MTADLPELRSRRLVLRRPLPQDVDTRLSLGQHKEIVEAYGGSFDPAVSFTRAHAETAIRFIENQEHAWVIDAGGFIGHIRLHGLVPEDRRGALAIGIESPAHLNKGYGAEAIRLMLTFAFERAYNGFRCGCWRATLAQSPATASVGSSRKVASTKQPS